MKRSAFNPFKRLSKYRNVKQTLPDGQIFDSKREAARYQELLLLQAAGEIVGEIERQVLIRLEVNGRLVCKYKPDFRYTLKTGIKVIDETKGFHTPEFKIKWKLMQAIFTEYVYVLS